MKIAVVTGASSGMGRQFALQLTQYEKFDEMWVIARRQQPLEELRAQVGCPVRPICLDLADSAALASYSALLQQHAPQVAVLVNCAGFGKFGRYDEIPLEDCMGMIDLNCKALVAMTQLTLPYMAAGGRIVQLDSLSAFQPVPYLNVYAATKAFVLSYSRALGRELRQRGVRVLAVCPGWVKTAFFDRAGTTSNTAITYFNALFQAEDVVRTALRQLYRGKKDVSIHGASIRLQVLATKLLPHRWVMEIWMRQQKHK